MALDLIKEYLVGIGFKVDENSLNSAESSMNQAQDNIKKFNDENKKGFSESGDVLKDLFSLFNNFNVGKLFPELKAPLNELMKDILTIKKVFNDVNNLSGRRTQDDQNTLNNNQTHQNRRNQNDTNIINPDNLRDIERLNDSSEEAGAGINNLLSSIFNLSGEGGSLLSGFSVTAVASFAAVAAGIVALIVAAKKLAEGIADLAKSDIEYEKLSRQLWTTKEQAKEVDMALKTMGVSMQDLWLSPTLLKQFNELRKDSAALKLPKEYTDNLKTVQGIGSEFNRLKQLGSLAFQWLGNSILNEIAGPLKDVKNGFKEFNDWLVKKIPGAAKIFGSSIGFAAKTIMLFLKPIGWFLEIAMKTFDAISEGFNKIPEPAKKSIKTIMILLLALTSPILLTIGLIDDLITYFKGGKSVIGESIDFVKNKWVNFKKYLKEKMPNFGEGWDNFYKKATEIISKVEKKIQQIIQNIKNFPSYVWEKAKENIPGFKAAVEMFNSDTGKNTVPTYATSNTSTSTTTTSNSNNKTTVSPTFNVYGSNPNSTANAISSKMSNLGLNTRNLQGAF